MGLDVERGRESQVSAPATKILQLTSTTGRKPIRQGKQAPKDVSIRKGVKLSGIRSTVVTGMSGMCTVVH